MGLKENTDMYKYEFETIKAEFTGYGMIKGSIYGTQDYRKIIEQRAGEGWRFVCVIPKLQRGTGHAEEIDLVFEKETLGE